MNLKNTGFFVACATVGACLVGMCVGVAAANPPPTIGLSMTVGVKHSDNRDSIPSGYLVNDEVIKKESQSEIWFRPTISLNHSIEGKYRLSFSYSPSYTYFDNPREGGTESEWSHAVRGLAEYHMSPRTTLTVSDNYWWSGAKDWHYGEDYEFDPNETQTRNDDYYKNNLSLAIRHQFSDSSWARATGRWNIKRYEEQFIADYGDEDEYVLLVELMRRHGRRLSYGIYSEYTAFDRNNGEAARPIGGSETPGRIDTGVQYLNTGVQVAYDFFGDRSVVVSARTGYNYMWYEADGIEDDDKIGDSVVELLLFQQARTSGKIGLKYGKEYGNVFPYSSQENTTLFASLSRVVGRQNKLRVGADVEYRTREYELAKVDPDAEIYGYYAQWIERRGHDGSAKRDSTFLRLHASYRWTEDFSTSVFYSYEDIDSQVDTSYTENTVGINATYRFR